MACLVGQQHVAVALGGTRGADLLRSSEAAAQQPITHQLWQPLTVQHVALTPRHSSKVVRVDQLDFKPGGIKHLEQGDFVRTGGLDRHGRDGTLAQPPNQALKIGGKGRKCLDWLSIPVRENGR